MTDMLARLGSASLEWLWLPALAWTVVAGAGLLILRYGPPLHPLLRYRLRQALLFALPATLLATPLMPVRLIPGGMLTPTPEVEPAAVRPTASREAEIIPASEAGVAEASFSDEASGRPSASTPPVGPHVHRAGSRDTSVLALLGGLAGIAALLFAAAQLRLLLGELLDLRRLGRTARRVTDAGSLRLLTRLCDELGVRRPVALLEGPHTSVPITFGVREPNIVVPAAMLTRSDELRMTLLHELVHVARADFGWALCERLVCVLFGVHPLVWWLAHGIERDRECSCDAEVVGSGHASPHSYATLLYAFGGRSRLRLGVAAGLATPASHLKERIETMKTFLNDPVRPRTRARSVIAGVTLLSSTALLGACMSIRESPRADETTVLSVDGRLTQEGLTTALKRLNAEVAYLDREMDAITAHGTKVDDWTRADRTRYELLNHMYGQTWQRIETLKMEQVANAVSPVDPLRSR